MRLLNTRFSTSVAVALTVGACALHPTSSAASMVLGYQELGPGTITGTGSVNTPAVPGTDFYGDVFTAPTSQIGTTGFGFYDDFLFSIPSATVQSLTVSLDLGKLLDINDLQVRLYNVAGNSPLPVLGKPSGGVIDAWSTSFSAGPALSGTVDVLGTTALTAGTYVLEVRGNVTGTAGGSYAGVLNLAPVPLPAGLPLLLSGLGVLGGALRRKVAG